MNLDQVNPLYIIPTFEASLCQCARKQKCFPVRVALSPGTPLKLQFITGEKGKPVKNFGPVQAAGEPRGKHASVIMFSF